MLRMGSSALAVSMVCASIPAALAADPAHPSLSEIGLRPGFYLHIGPAGVFLDEGATMKADGQRVPGADISIAPQPTAVVEAGYFFTPNLAVSLTGGLPPFAEIEAAGSLKGLGMVGETTYGPVTLTAHYHFTGLGRVQPYIGLGPAFMVVFDETDGLMGDLQIDHAFGFAFQAGLDLMLDKHWGVFVDVKKAILRTRATGFIGPVPVEADVTLDPLVLNAGVSYRF
jgi:outer membrane protein